MDFHVKLVHLIILHLGPQKLNSMPFMEHLQEFNLDLCTPIYSNFPQVSCLGMNSRRGWNPNLEGSYIPEQRESKAEFWKKCKLGFYIRSLQFSTLDPSPISGYRECTKTYHFQYLGFFQIGVKLGFDFPGVSPNQKY